MYAIGLQADVVWQASHASEDAIWSAGFMDERTVPIWE